MLLQQCKLALLPHLKFEEYNNSRSFATISPCHTHSLWLNLWLSFTKGISTQTTLVYAKDMPS